MSSVSEMIRAAIAPLARRVRIMVARGIIELVDDAKNGQIIQVSTRADMVADDVERFGQFGLTSVPDVGAECIVLSVGGSASHPVIVAVEDRRYRPTGLKVGEVALYTKDDGKRVYCKDDGTIELGTSPTDFVSMAKPTKDALDKIATWAGVVCGAVNSLATGTFNPSNDLSTMLSDTAATEVKAK